MVTTEAHDARFALITLFPPLGVPKEKLPPRVPRDVLFLIDTSGSMSGESIGQAQTGLLRCIDMLQPQDMFTIVRFASDYWASHRTATGDPGICGSGPFVCADLASRRRNRDAESARLHLVDPERTPERAAADRLTDGDVGNEETSCAC